MPDPTKDPVVEANSRRPSDASWLVVPVEPTPAMLEAAVDAASALERDRTAGSWIRPAVEAADGTELLVHQDEVRMRGLDRAFRLEVAREAWRGCLAGLEEWIGVRGRRGSDRFTDWWMHPAFDRVPEGGWDARPDRSALVAFTVPHHVVFPPPGDGFRIVPVSACEIMCLRGAQADLGCLGWATVEDALDQDAMPFIKGLARETRHDEEERPNLVVAAMWRGAVACVLDGAMGSGTLAEHPQVQARWLLAWAARRARSWGCLDHEPSTGRLTAGGRGAKLEVDAEPGRLSWRLERPDGSTASDTAARFRGDVPPPSLAAAMAEIGPEPTIAWTPRRPQ